MIICRFVIDYFACLKFLLVFSKSKCSTESIQFSISNIDWFIGCLIEIDLFVTMLEKTRLKMQFCTMPFMYICLRFISCLTQICPQKWNQFEINQVCFLLVFLLFWYWSVLKRWQISLVFPCTVTCVWLYPNHLITIDWLIEMYRVT